MLSSGGQTHPPDILAFNALHNRCTGIGQAASASCLFEAGTALEYFFFTISRGGGGGLKTALTGKRYWSVDRQHNSRLVEIGAAEARAILEREGMEEIGERHSFLSNEERIAQTCV